MTQAGVDADSDAVVSRIEGRVGTVVLNRPEARNALSPELTDALITQVRALDRDPQVKCIVLRGQGDNFSAGGDVKSFNQALALSPEQRHAQFEKRLLVGSRLPNVILQTNKPVIVVTQGAVAGAGLALALAADFTVCAASSYFIAAHVHVGLSLDVGLSRLLVETIGIKQAKRLALLGERIDATQALALGLVTEVVSDESVDEVVHKLIVRLSSGPQRAMQGSKQLLNAVAYAGLDGQLADEARHIAACTAEADFEEGVRAMLEKRRPRFA